MSYSRKHVLMVSAPALSHITSLFNLAKKVSFHHDVTFVVSCIRAKQLRDREVFTGNDDARLRIVGLSDGLTEEDANESSPLAIIQTMLGKTTAAVATMLQNVPVAGQPGSNAANPVVDQQITQPVDIFIGDLQFVFLIDVLVQRGLPIYLFSPTPAFVTANKLNIDLNTPRLPDEAFFSDWESHRDVALTGVPASIMAHFTGNEAAKFQHVKGMIFNSLVALEPDSVSRMEAHPVHQHRPLRFVAPLFSPEPVVSAREKTVLEWLDKQPSREVVYVSFGTMAVSAKEQVEEIAKSLLALRKPFIWVLRSEEQSLLTSDLRSSDIPHLILTWAPQLSILQHPSTAVFVTHGGWNGCLESMHSGVPMVVWPLFGDQYGNAKLVEKLGIGSTVSGTTMLFVRIVRAEEIAAIIKKVAGWQDDGNRREGFFEKAEDVKKSVREAAVPGGSSYQAFLDFVNIDLNRTVKRSEK